VAWRAATRTVAGVGDLVQRTEDGRTGRVLGGRAVERSGGARVRSAPDTWRLGARVSRLSLKKQGRRFVSGLASKPLGRFLAIWPQNLL
jgi:hypothetical protein